MIASTEMRAVLFDLGGVVLPSPLEAMRTFEEEHGLPHRFLAEVILASPGSGAWDRMERGELTVDAFVPAFEAECAARGHEVDATAMMARIGVGLAPRPEMLDAIGGLRRSGYKVGALTNNWVEDDDAPGAHPLHETFDAVVESARVGLRKPDPRIYRLACATLAVEPHETVFLDDLGANLKPARAMGMTTIKVVDAASALAELAAILDMAPFEQWEQ